jgi:hypothetical protein
VRNPITPQQTRAGNFEEFRIMLSQVVGMAAICLDKDPLHKPAVYSPKGSWLGYDGLYIPDSNSFSLTILHNAEDFIVFSPDEENLFKNYKFDKKKADSLSQENYEVVNYHPGFNKPAPGSPYQYQVAFRSNLNKGLFQYQGFYSLKKWEHQREWLKEFLIKAWSDVGFFGNSSNVPNLGPRP